MAREGQAPTLRVVLADPSQRKQAEGALRTIADQYRRIAEDLPLFVVTCLPDGTLTFANDVVSALVGLLKSSAAAAENDLVAKVQECVGSLSEMLTDLLDVSKLDAGVLTPKVASFDIDEMLACRRRQGRHWVEVWDTGVGIAEHRLSQLAIYH